MRGYFRWITNRPRRVLAVAALAALLPGAYILTLAREPSPDAFIPNDHPALALKERVEALFHISDPIAIGVIRDQPGGVFTPDTLRLIEHLTEAVRRLPGVEPENVLSIATESGVYFEDGEPGFDRLLRRIPETPEGLQALKADILAYELYQGTLLAKDGSAATVLIRIPDDDAADRIYRATADLLQTSDITGRMVQGERLVVAGEAAVRAHMGVAVSDDALRMNLICPFVMLGLIVLAYRTVRGTLLPLCVIGGASAWALGFMAIAEVPIYIVTNGIFVIIMALGVADSLHLVGQYYEEQLDPDGRDRQNVVISACCALWFPLLVTTLTDFGGFLALWAVGTMPPIRYFGLFTCAGIIGAFVYSFTVIPAGLMLVPLRMSGAFRRRKEVAGEGVSLDAVATILGRLGLFTLRRSTLIVLVGVLLLPLIGWGASKLIINDARILAFKDHHPIVQATNTLNDRFDGTSRLNVMLTAAKEGAFDEPESVRRIEALEAFTESLPYVGGTHSLAGWVKRAHQKLNKEDPDFYVVPSDRFEIQYYLDVLGDERASPMAHLLNEVIDESHTRANLTIRMTSSEYIHQREVIQLLEAYLAEHFSDGAFTAEVAGRVHLDYHWLDMVKSTHIKSVVLSMACVLVLTGLMFRSVVAGILCSMTVGLAVLVNYAVMGFSGIPLGVGTAMFASIAIGAGVNSPIHVLDRLRSRLRNGEVDAPKVFHDTLAFTGRALFFTAFVVAVGFGLLCVSEFRTLIRFGLLISVAMITSFLVSVTLLPAIVAAVRPRFVWGRGGNSSDETRVE